MDIGFSTGAVAGSNLLSAIALLKDIECNCIELSALRESELDLLVDTINNTDLSKYKYISAHAPSKFSNEKEIVEKLHKIRKGINIIVHPDVIKDFDLWIPFGKRLCIENMDGRKNIGRTVDELQTIFDYIPGASFCFDIGHARQIDKSMREAELMLNIFYDRMRQIHISEVDDNYKHNCISKECLNDFKKVADRIPNVPFIIESVSVNKTKINKEIYTVMELK